MTVRSLGVWYQSWKSWLWSSNMTEEESSVFNNRISYYKNINQNQSSNEDKKKRGRAERINEMVSKCSSFKRFEPSTILPPSGHVQSLLTLWRDLPKVEYRREILIAPDGGEIVLDWSEHAQYDALKESSQEPSNKSQEETEKKKQKERPIVAIFHGLAGSSQSSYVLHLVSHLRSYFPQGKCVVMAARGCCPERKLKSPIVQSAAFTEDIRTLSKYLKQNFPHSPIFAVGFSLGANILCKYLGEESDKSLFDAAMILANPFDLVLSNRNFDNFVEKNVYSPFLVRGLKEIVKRNLDILSQIEGINLEQVLNSATVRDFDQSFVIKAHKYNTVHDYYHDASSSRYAHNIKIPTLIVNAQDDPIAPVEAVPLHLADSNENLVFLITPFGGHLGWMHSLSETWTDRVCLEWIQASLASQDSESNTYHEDESNNNENNNENNI